MLRKLSAEALGTLLLVATVIGSGIMGERLSGGNDAIALLGNTLATGAILVVLITIFAPVSGAHFNPAVTFVMALKREIAAWPALAYAVAQIAGGVLGAMLAHAMFDLPLLAEGLKARTGAAIWIGEAVATAALILTILGTLRAAPKMLALNVGLAISAGYWFTSSTSFANPAVAIARGFTPTFSGIRPEDVWGFVGIEFAAAALAGLLAFWQWPSEKHASS